MTDRETHSTHATDPLAAIGESLVAAARRRHRARGRRRRAAGTLAATAAVVAACAVVLAVTGAATGFHELDRWLGAEPDRSAPLGEPALPAPPLPDLAPGGASSPPVEVDVGRGRTWTGIGFESAQQRMVCGRLVDPDADPDEPLGRTCLGRRGAERTLAHKHFGVTGGGGLAPPNPDGSLPISVSGVARADVEALTLVWPDGRRTAAALTEPWTPSWRDAPLRVYLAVSTISRGERDLGPRALLRATRPVRGIATLSDGRTVAVGP